MSNTVNVPNPFLGLLPPASTLGQGSTVRATQLIKRYPQFSTVTEQSNNTGRGLYHSLQTRFSPGLQLVANFTHSKSMQYLQYSDVNERHWRTVSPIDIPNMFNLFLTYQLPFGRGQVWGRNWGRALDTLGGGWNLVFILFSRDVWNRIANFKVSPEPPLCSWLRGPSQWTQTATMSKTVVLTELLRTELRMQASSPFNHTVFNNPATNLASPATFGVITASRGNSTRTITFGAKPRF